MIQRLGEGFPGLSFIGQVGRVPADVDTVLFEPGRQILQLGLGGR